MSTGAHATTVLAWLASINPPDAGIGHRCPELRLSAPPPKAHALAAASTHAIRSHPPNQTSLK